MSVLLLLLFQAAAVSHRLSFCSSDGRSGVCLTVARNSFMFSAGIHLGPAAVETQAYFLPQVINGIGPVICLDSWSLINKKTLNLNKLRALSRWVFFSLGSSGISKMPDDWGS